MKTVEELRLEALQRVRTFLRDDAPEDGRLESLREELDDVLPRLEGHIADQRTATNLVTWKGEETERLREELRSMHLLPIVRRGRPLVRNQPRCEEMLKVPHKRSGTPALVKHAIALAEWLGPFEAAFVEKKFPRNFRSQLRVAAKALAKQSKGSASAREARSVATAGIKQELRRGSDIKLGLDGLLRPILRDSVWLRSKWAKIMRIQKKRGRPKRRKPRPQPTEAE